MAKMLYLYVGGAVGRTSVRTKIGQIISKFNELGLDTEGIFFSQHLDKTGRIDSYIQEMPIEKVSVKYFASYHQHRKNIETVFEYLNAHHEKYDVIFLRYPGANKALYQGMKKLGSKVVFEHNTKSYEEMKRQFEMQKFGLRPSAFLSWFQNQVLLLPTEGKWSKRIWPLARLGLGVTDDIVEYEKRRALGRYNCHSSPNGVLVEDIKFRDYVPVDEEGINVALISGANNPAPYIGVDRILDGFKNYKGTVKINLILIGSLFVRNKEMIEAIKELENVQVLGKLDEEELNEAFKKIHLSLGSVGLHRIGMTEGSVLKVNDSLSRGVPVVVAHKDMELKNCSDFEPYFCVFPADESPIDFAVIADFVMKLSEDENHPKKIRELAKNQIDLDPKLRKVIHLIDDAFDLNMKINNS